jgi:hypothetical protein
VIQPKEATQLPVASCSAAPLDDCNLMRFRRAPSQGRIQGRVAAYKAMVRTIPQSTTRVQVMFQVAIFHSQDRHCCNSVILCVPPIRRRRSRTGVLRRSTRTEILLHYVSRHPLHARQTHPARRRRRWTLRLPWKRHMATFYSRQQQPWESLGLPSRSHSWYADATTTSVACVWMVP